MNMKSTFMIRHSNCPLPVIADLMQVKHSGQDPLFEVTRINVPVPLRGQGLGTQILDQICAEADVQGVTLRLSVVPSGPLSAQELRDWYSRRGFILEEDGFMYRPALAEMFMTPLTEDD